MLRLWSGNSVSVIAFTLVNMPKYAVARGKIPGIYDTWAECKLQVDGFCKPVYKKFATLEEAEAFIAEKQTQNQGKSVIAQQALLQTAEPSLSESPLQSLWSKVNAIDSRLNKFMDDVSNRLNNLSTRLLSVEGKRNAANANLDDNESAQTSKKPRDDYDFKISPEGHVEVYTDGACSKNGRSGARAGVGVWFGDNHPLNLSVPVTGPPTNNNAEIQAARLAITQAADAGVSKLTVYTDSEFMISCITQWIHKWKKNNWKLSDGGQVKNKDELVKLDEALQRIAAVRWVHVRGHSGVRGNEEADKLAREGAKLYDPYLTYSISS